MKVQIDGYGSMTVSADNGVENYALRKWFEEWLANKVTLYIGVQDATGVPEYKLVPQVRDQTP